jgi:hypothetical protein
MQEIFENLSAKIKKHLNKAIWTVASVFLFIVVISDLDRPDGGYIMPTVIYITGVVMACGADAIEIADTPLASLTIAKIFILAWYCLIAWFLANCAWGIWSYISDLLSRHQENQIEEERQKEEEEDSLYFDSKKECAECVVQMQSALTLSELDTIFSHAIRRWPMWEKQLSRVYKKRKSWLEENTPDY